MKIEFENGENKVSGEMPRVFGLSDIFGHMNSEKNCGCGCKNAGCGAGA